MSRHEAARHLMELAKALLPVDRAPDLQPDEIGSLEDYALALEGGEEEMALIALARIGEGCEVPRRFWEHLVAAAESAELPEYAELYRARL